MGNLGRGGAWGKWVVEQMGTWEVGEVWRGKWAKL